MRFRGEVTVEVRALVFTPYVDFIFPSNGDALKRAKTNSIEWSGGNTTDQLLLELYQNGSKLQTIETTNNTGRFTWAIPETARPGQNYQIRISKVDQPSNFAISQPFAIKRKVPLGLKVLPILAIGGALGVVMSGGDGGGGPTGPGDQSIPDPPDPE